MLCACAGIRQAGAFGSTGGRSGMSKASTSSDCGGDGASRAPDSSPCIHMSRTVNASVTMLTEYQIPGGKNSRTLMSVSNQLSVCCSVGESFAILARASAREWYMAVASRRMRGSATPSSSSSVASGDAMEETVMESRLRMEVSIEDANPGRGCSPTAKPRAKLAASFQGERKNIPVPLRWRRAVLPSLPWVVCFLSFLAGLGLESAVYGWMTSTWSERVQSSHESSAARPHPASQPPQAKEAHPAGRTIGIGLRAIRP